MQFPILLYTHVNDILGHATLGDQDTFVASRVSSPPCMQPRGIRTLLWSPGCPHHPACNPGGSGHFCGPQGVLTTLHATPGDQDTFVVPRVSSPPCMQPRGIRTLLWSPGCPHHPACNPGGSGHFCGPQGVLTTLHATPGDQDTFVVPRVSSPPCMQPRGIGTLLWSPGCPHHPACNPGGSGHFCGPQGAFTTLYACFLQKM